LPLTNIPMHPSPRTLVLLAVLPVLVAAAAMRPARVVQVTVGAEGEMRFEPDTVTLHRDDVVRFVAFSGVHNVHFPKEANPGAAHLPAVSDWLLREGDHYELKVELAPGTYHFQCDPHALMGMKGTLVVAP
jgi:plastocyanin